MQMPLKQLHLSALQYLTLVKSRCGGKHKYVDEDRTCRHSSASPLDTTAPGSPVSGQWVLGSWGWGCCTIVPCSQSEKSWVLFAKINPSQHNFINLSFPSILIALYRKKLVGERGCYQVLSMVFYKMSLLLWFCICMTMDKAEHQVLCGWWHRIYCTQEM